MTDERYAVTQLDELDRLPFGERGLEWRPVRRRFDLRAFGMNAYTSADVGGEVVEEHDEGFLGHEEVYVVVRGRATFHLDGQDFDAPAGTIVAIKDPSVRRAATSAEPDTFVLAVGGKPGEPFHPSGWESAFAAGHLADGGKVDEALALVQRDMAEYGETPEFVYQLAVFEALAGRRDDAARHLIQAIDAAPRLARSAKISPRLAPIRDDPRVSEAIERHAT
jgi:hypothetical protein